MTDIGKLTDSAMTRLATRAINLLLVTVALASLYMFCVFIVEYRRKAVEPQRAPCRALVGMAHNGADSLIVALNRPDCFEVSP